MATLRTRKQADVTISGGDSVFLFKLITPLARAWVADNVSDDHHRFGDAVAVEHRYVAALATGMHQNGLVIGFEEDN